MRNTIAVFRHELALVEEHCLRLMKMVAKDLQDGHTPRHEVAFNLAKSSRRRVVLSTFFKAAPRRGPINDSDEHIRDAVGRKLVAALQGQRMIAGRSGEPAADLVDAFEEFLEELGMTEAEFDPDAAPRTS